MRPLSCTSMPGKRLMTSSMLLSDRLRNDATSYSSVSPNARMGGTFTTTSFSSKAFSLSRTSTGCAGLSTVSVSAA